METKEQRRVRSKKQQGYQWGSMYPDIVTGLHKHGVRFAGERIIDCQQVHSWAKPTFVPMVLMALWEEACEEAERLGKAHPPPPTEKELAHPSTATLCPKGFALYVRFIQEHFAQRGVDVKDPNEEQMMACYGTKIINRGERACLPG